MKRDFGRHVYGAASIIFAAITVAWHVLDASTGSKLLADTPYREVLIYVAAAAALVGGIAIQWTKTARLGALVLGILYLCFSALLIPPIVRAPAIYDNWGNFFEQFSIFSGALIVYAAFFSNESPWAAKAARIGSICFGICAVSFALEQAFHLRGTADAVPKWIPPGQMFWAITTTVAFLLAAIAILWGRQALLASRLLTTMLLLFGLLIWLPAVFTAPHSHFVWSEGTETLEIAAVAWILADYLNRKVRISAARS